MSSIGPVKALIPTAITGIMANAWSMLRNLIDDGSATTNCGGFRKSFRKSIYEDKF